MPARLENYTCLVVLLDVAAEMEATREHGVSWIGEENLRGHTDDTWRDKVDKKCKAQN